MDATLTGEGDGSTATINQNTLLDFEADTNPVFNICVEKVTKAHTDDLFDANAVSDTSDIFSLPANSVLMAIVIDLDTQFAGIDDLNIEVGITGDDTDGFLAPGAMDLTSDSAGSNYSNRGAYWSATTTGFYYAATAKTITAKAVTTDADGLDETSAGNVTFYIVFMTLPTTA